MTAYGPLVREIRGETLDLIHFGYLAIVDERGRVIYSVGDPDAVVYYRSASKPIQALPVIRHGLDARYGITEEESVIFAGSHAGEPFHIAALESIFEKAGLREDMLCMKPTCPGAEYANEARIAQGLPRRKFYHNCAGKHAALMLVQRELGGDVADYWRMGAAAQLEVQAAIQTVSESEHVELGVDGCGVPVFAVPIRCIATAFRNLAAPDLIRDDALQEAARAFVPRIHRHPLMMRGTGYLCSLINYDDNIVGKGGANGVYGFALKRERLGVAFKFIDGTENAWPLVIMETLRALGCLSAESEARFETLHPRLIFNDNDLLVGRKETCFEVSVP